MKILQLLRDNAGREKRPLNAASGGDSASIYIYDVISADWGVSALAVIAAIEQAGDVKTLNVHINSPGGDVFEGRAIMAALRRFAGNKVAHIDSLCASAATSIALACDEVVMAEGAFFMIHNSMTIGYGNKNDLRDTADTLEKIDGAITNDYVAKTGKDAADIRAWMDAETWFTAAEALDNGFIDRVAAADKKAKNTWNLAAFAKVPDALKEPAPPVQTSTPPIRSMSTANANRLRLLQIA